MSSTTKGSGGAAKKTRPAEKKPNAMTKKKKKRPAVVLREGLDGSNLDVAEAQAATAAVEADRVKRLKRESDLIELKIAQDALKDAEAKLALAERRLAARNYLGEWKDRESTAWRFNKKLQTWWVQHAFDLDVSKDDFALFCEYAATIEGGVRDRLKSDATAKVAEAKVGEDDDPQTKKLRIRAVKLANVLRKKKMPPTSSSSS